MALAIFDLDNTLLSGDSDYLWGVFLAEQGVVDGEFYERENQRFYDEYKAGCLDINEFLRFSLSVLKVNDPQQMRKLRARYIAEKIEPIISRSALDLVESHRKAGDTLMIITATNAFVTEPIAAKFGIPHLIATDPEMVDGKYTGEVAGIPSFQQGKVKRLEEWLAENGGDLSGSTFYSDSHNDLPLLEKVDKAVAVDPDDVLRKMAGERGWTVISLRQ